MKTLLDIDTVPLDILQLPYDIYDVIFSKIRVRFVIKRRCVCKQWKLHIDEHLKRYASDTNVILTNAHLFNRYAGTIESLTLSSSKYPKLNNTRIRQCTSLTSLELDYNARVNENGFKHLNTLQELIVSDASDMSMDDISTSLTNLTKLVLSESYDLSNGHLEKLTKLKTLTLTYCWGVDWSHLKLQTLSHLEELSLDDHYGDPIYIYHH
jgi:hypothetical protein